MVHLTGKYYDISRLVLWCDAPAEDGGKRARMVFGFRDGNPRISVYSGATGAEGVISFPADAPTMVTLLNYLKDVAVGVPGTKMSVDSLTTVYANDAPTNEKRVLSTLHLGKSKEGIVYLSVISENRPKLVFPIKPTQYHAFRDAEKNLVPESKVSETMAIGIANMLLNIITQVLVQHTNEEYETGVRKATTVKTRGGAAAPVKAEMIQELDDLGL